MPLDIVHPDVEAYLQEIAPQSEQVLRELEEEAKTSGFPIVGPLVGRLFFVLARALKAESVFELGSGFGYSALWWARALGTAGRVILTEGDPGNSDRARTLFRRAGLADRAIFEIGDALETLGAYPGPFDIIFCDIDKHDYPRAFEAALPKLRKGGLLVFDNVLWSGRVAEADSGDRETPAVRELNRRLMASTELVTTILPLRDGVAVATKL